MGMYTIQNEEICIKVNSFGAELTSLQDVNTKREYMWSADPTYWKRTSPILFPFVGGLKNKEYSYEGKTYPMSQHGFARDMEFQLIEQTASKLLFALESDEETLQKYPFAFQLILGYELKGRKVIVSWQVNNKDQKKMYFAIGGHPAFLCPIDPDKKQTDYEIYFGTDEITSSMIGESGLMTTEKIVYPLQDGALSVTEDLFEHDALVIEHNQTQKVAFLDENEMPYLTVSFDAPLFGIWSPPHKNAPFICIEPWYGRCDAEDFEGNLAEREWENSLEVNGTFKTKYSISI
ncbi:MAG: aldose 1-epimerase family protein [Lachnospiraceae bacterium]|nr:aldose 1-epimerase family protein [Lachnospiraceae bacterium]